MKHLLALAFTGLVASQASFATVLDFNELAHDDYYHAINPYTSNGFTISNSGSGDSLGVWARNSSSQADTGNAAVFVNYGYTTTVLESTSSLPFSFTSIDLADVYNTGVSSTIEFSFTNISNQVFSQVVTLDNAKGLQTFAFNQQNLKQVQWKTLSGDNGWGQFDNIQVAPVPEPETYALMGMGLVGLLAARRRKAKQA